MAAIFAAPEFFNRNLEFHSWLKDSHSKIFSCVEDWRLIGNVHSAMLFNIILFFIQYVIPLTIVATIHLEISFALGDQINDRKELNLAGSLSREQNCTLIRLNRCFITMVVAFGIQWLPLNLLILFDDWGVLPTTKLNYIIFFFCHLTAMSSGIWNFKKCDFSYQMFHVSFHCSINVRSMFESIILLYHEPTIT